jgi:hypothetical protein
LSASFASLNNNSATGTLTAEIEYNSCVLILVNGGNLGICDATTEGIAALPETASSTFTLGCMWPLGANLSDTGGARGSLLTDDS